MTACGRRQIVDWDKQFVWHPYTPMSRYLTEGSPLVIDRAQGSRLWDLDGREYIDGNSSWWVASLGHNHPRLINALQAQAQKMCHVALAGITHEPAAALAKELVEVAPPGLSRVFYSDDGSTAVELALKMCLQYWHQNGEPERRKFVALSDAFHGETLGVTALGGVEVFRRHFQPVLMECVQIDLASEPEAALRKLSDLLQAEAGRIAGCVIEPLVQGAGGMRMYDAETLRRVRELTTQHDVFLVVDEVFTGYGRTGPMWACEHAAVSPDVMCVAKGFTSGILPMAATLCTSRIFDGFLGDDDRALYYGHTYCGHPLGAAVAREVLAVYQQERILERAAPKARRLSQTIERLGQLDGVARPRALGMVGAVSLGERSGYLEKAGWRVSELARERGVYLRPLGDVVYVAPALNIDDDDLETLLEVLEECVKSVLGE